MDTKFTSLLESYFDFFYAREIIDIMDDVLKKKKCVGCLHGHLSQLEHTCTWSVKEQLELYWDDVLREVSEVDVILKWRNAISLMENIPSPLVDMYKMKLDCVDWRETDMKTLAWKTRIIRMTVTILQLEKRFT